MNRIRLQLAVLLALSMAPGAQSAVVLESLGTFDYPAGVTHAGDGSGRVFVAGLDGVVSVVAQGQILAQPLVDFSDRTEASGEGGLLGLAFAPDFATSGFVFALFVNSDDENELVRFHVPNGSSVADPGSVVTVLRIEDGGGHHYGGDIAFGSDGMLYLTVGDGGVASRAQDLSSLRGKILRINVSSLPYAVPSDNPFASDAAGAATLGEIWHYGLRNPWRFSFDRFDGEMWIGDVGGAYEEVHTSMPGEGGLNFGWPCYTGPDQVSCSLPDHVPPRLFHDHNQSDCAMVGGYRARGPVPELNARYVYGDFCTGRIWSAEDLGGNWQRQLLIDHPSPLSSFGQDQSGHVYVSEYGPGATVWRLASDSVTDLIFVDGFEE